jgi:hypothetical protein
MISKTKRAAHSAKSAAPRNNDQLGSKIDPTDRLKPARAQEPRPRPPPDIEGESDWTFFSRRPFAFSRIRFPFEDEFPPCVLAPGRIAFVHVWLVRSIPDGRPLRRRRALRFCQGGRA